MTAYLADMERDLDRCALVVVDVQQGFDDPWWGRRDNPACDDNISSLVAQWVARDRPLVFVQHASENPESPLHPKSPGRVLKGYLAPYTPDLLVTKSVNSSFHGEPNLDRWLRARSIDRIAVCGITTNHCCETTARVGGNLGYDVLFVTDATHTFDRQAPDGDWLSAEQLARTTATNLHDEFATVVSTEELLRPAEG